MAHQLPEGKHTITPHLSVKGASEAIEFYKEAFGAEELYRLPYTCPDSKVRLAHATLRIGDSWLFLADEFPGHEVTGPSGSSPVTIHLHVDDADAAFERAIKAGATVTMALDDMFWGDRYGKLVDPFGHYWSIAAPSKPLSPENMQQLMQEQMATAFGAGSSDQMRRTRRD